GWLGDPGALSKYTVRLSNYTVVEAQAPGIVEYTGKIKSVDPESRTAVVLITAKSAGRKIFGLATAEVRLSWARAARPSRDGRAQREPLRTQLGWMNTASAS